MNKAYLKIIFLIGLILVFCSVGVYAAEDNDHGIKDLISAEKQTILYMNEQIDSVMQKEMKPKKLDERTAAGVPSGMHQIISYDLEQAFILYTIGGMTPIKESGSFETSFQNSFKWWKIPAKNRAGGTSIVSLKYVDGEFQWSGTTFGDGVEALIVDYQKLEKAVSESEEITEQIQEMRIVQSPAYSTCYIYLKTENNEYLIPYYFIERFNELGLEKYKVYRAMDLVDMYYDYYDETKYSDSDEIMYGGVPIREKTYWGYIVCVSCILAGLLTLTIFSIKRRKKRGLF